MSTTIWTHEDITLERTRAGMINAWTWVTDLGGRDRLNRVMCDTMAGAVEVVQVWLELMQVPEDRALEVLATIPGLGESWDLEDDCIGAYVVDLEDLGDD